MQPAQPSLPTHVRRHIWPMFLAIALPILMMMCAVDIALAQEIWHVDAEVNDGLVGYWKFDEGTGAVTRNSAIITHTATLENGAAFSPTLPVSLTSPNFNSLDLDGVDDQVAVPDIPQLNLNTNFSVAAWISHDTTNGTIYESSDLSVDNSWRMSIQVGQKLTFGVDGVIALPGTSTIPANEWHHIAVVVSQTASVSNTVSLFVDGNFETSYVIGALDPAGGTKFIGRRAEAASQHFKGLIDDLRLYNRVLSTDEIARLALGRGCPTDGESWPTAFIDLQCALDVAQRGDEVWVADGVYRPGTAAAATYGLVNGVEIYGGFAGGEGSRDDRDWRANPAVLSGDLDGNDSTDASGVVTDTANIAGTNALHVVTGFGAGSSTVLDGFFVTAGSATGTSSPDDRGGGMENTRGSATLANLTFSGNLAGNVGGGIFNAFSSSTLTNVTLSGNTAGRSGGGIMNSSSIPTLVEVTFGGNVAGTDGGGLFNTGGKPTLTNVTFIENVAGNAGGGMRNIATSATLTNVTFDGNTAGNTGGGMANDSSSPTLTGVTFDGNTVGSNGGGIANTDGSNPTLTDVTISGSLAGTNGGGMFNDDSSPTLTNVSFISNTAGSTGGGIYSEFSSPTLTDAAFISNTAGLDGGGMANSNSSPTLTGVLFAGNTAPGASPNGLGGGMYNFISNVEISNVSFRGNTANRFGGGMANIAGNGSLINVIFSGNRVFEFGGGGMENRSLSDWSLTNVTFSGNMAGDRGGGMNNNNSDPLLQNTILWDNSAPTDANIATVDSSNPVVRFSLIQGGIGVGSIDGGNNLFDDPLFTRAVDCGADGCGDDPATPSIDESANDDYGDLRLLPASPAIDAGDNDADLDGDDAGTLTISDVISDLAAGPRIVAVRQATPTVDLGAFEAPNSPPSFASSPTLNATENVTYTYAISSADPNQSGGSGLTLTALVRPDWLNLIDNGDGSGALSGAPSNDDVGDHPVTLQVQERLGLAASQSFVVTVANVNDAPSFTSTPVTTATVGESYSYSISTADPDADDILTVTALAKPAWLSLTDNGDGTATLSGTPTAGDVGSDDVVLQVEDAGELTDEQVFDITVNPATTGGVEGQVLDEDEGVPGVTVTLNSDAAVEAAAVVDETVTDTAGKYGFAGLSPGVCSLTFEPPPGYATPDSVEVTVVAGETTTVPGVSLTPSVSDGDPNDLDQRLYLPNLVR